MTILALTARSEAGKDWLAEYNINELGYTRVSFNDQIKKLANHIYAWCDLDYPSELKNVPIQHDDNALGLSPREIWKSLDVLCNTDPLIYINTAIVEAKSIISNGGNVIFPEIRKDVEMEAVRSLGATVIKITTPVMTDRTDENIIDKFEVDYTFENVKGIGYAEWIKFLQQTSIVKTSWATILPNMIDIQHNVNDTFNPKWNTVIEERLPADCQWRAAVSCEHGELMDELGDACVLMQPSDINKDKALEKLVCVFSFALGYVMSYFNDLPEMKKAAGHVSFMVNNKEHDFVGSTDVEKLVNLHAELSSRIELDLDIDWADIYDTSGYMINLCKYASIGCKILGVTIGEFFEMYKAKHELKLARAKSGYLTTGDKSGLETVSAWKIKLNTK